MRKITFLKAALVLSGGALLLRSITRKFKASASTKPHTRLKNWAGNLTYSTDKVHYPSTLQEVQGIVRGCSKLRALGSRHSFNYIADNRENLVSLQNMDALISLDKAAQTVTVESGMRYGELAPFLDANGYALPNLASLPHITVVGACTTATHGSGIQNGNLATSVVAIEFVNASGELVTMSRQEDGELFNGAVVALGGLGIVTKITLDLVPSFKMTQFVYRNLPMGALKDHFVEIISKGYSVSLFTHWENQNINQVWIKCKAEKGVLSYIEPELFGAKVATQKLHPIESQSPENTTDQLGEIGEWYERLPHFKMGFKPSAGAELQSEYFVAIEHAYDAIMAIESLHEKISPHLFVSEIRTIKADELWLSPQFKQTTVAFHFTWKQDEEVVLQLLPLIEEKLAPFNARPHWGKLFTMEPKVLQVQYERMEDFRQLLLQHDPEGKFRNEFMEKYVFGNS
ncbi:FAD-binding protein [Rufibacter latericius]|uniref:FAD-binding protein n=1 Tax=Rufibacter latericius TaxID=2487040 RepID=A0A3M9MVC0_9BACT|nr:FAD-binding protein [Rufibacter latericius]RNI29135.1 FAD-binding protein [Rufibacter latericius]